VGTIVDSDATVGSATADSLVGVDVAVVILVGGTTVTVGDEIVGIRVTTLLTGVAITPVGVLCWQAVSRKSTTMRGKNMRFMRSC
jgi:hypothetical protein